MITAEAEASNAGDLRRPPRRAEAVADSVCRLRCGNGGRVGDGRDF